MGQCNCIERKEKPKSDMERRQNYKLDAKSNTEMDNYISHMQENYRRSQLNNNNQYASTNEYSTYDNLYSKQQNNSYNSMNYLSDDGYRDSGNSRKYQSAYPRNTAGFNQQYNNMHGQSILSDKRGSFQPQNNNFSFQNNHSVSDCSFFENQSKIKIIIKNKRDTLRILNSCKHYVDDKIIPTYIVPHPIISQNMILVFQSVDLISRKKTENLNSETLTFEHKQIKLYTKDGMSTNYKKISDQMNSMNDHYNYLGFYTDMSDEYTELNLIFYYSSERKSRQNLNNMYNIHTSNNTSGNFDQSKLYFELEMVSDINREQIENTINDRLRKGQSMIKGLIQLQFQKSQQTLNVLLFEKFDQNYLDLMIPEIKGTEFMTKTNQSDELSQKIDLLCNSPENFCFAGMLTDLYSKNIYIIIANEQ